MFYACPAAYVGFCRRIYELLWPTYPNSNNQNDFTSDDNVSKIYLGHNLLIFLRNLSTHGGEQGRKVVEEAVTDDLLHILPDVDKSIARKLGEEVW